MGAERFVSASAAEKQSIHSMSAVPNLSGHVCVTERRSYVLRHASPTSWYRVRRAWRMERIHPASTACSLAHMTCDGV